MSIRQTSVLVWILLIAFGVWVIVTTGDQSDADIVDAYCAYGARSEAHWNGCTEHVTADDVRRRSTRAALCATEGGDPCDRGYGPFWKSWQELRGFCSDGEFVRPELCRGRAERYVPR